MLSFYAFHFLDYTFIFETFLNLFYNTFKEKKQIFLNLPSIVLITLYIISYINYYLSKKLLSSLYKTSTDIFSLFWLWCMIRFFKFSILFSINHLSFIGFYATKCNLYNWISIILCNIFLYNSLTLICLFWIAYLSTLLAILN